MILITKLKNLTVDDINTIVKITGTVNTRHIGGYKGHDGRITDELAFIRSDVPHSITCEDMKFLLERGIETVLDFRTQEEVDGTPVPFDEIAEFSYVMIPLISDETPPHLMKNTSLGSLYVHILEDRKNQIAEALRMINRTNGGVFFNCSAGKDRTGIMAMILLMLAGVDKQDVITDYYFTEILLEPWIKEVVPKLEAQGSKVDVKMFEALPEYIEKAIDHIEENYGTIENYVKSIGLSDEEIKKLVEKVLK